jgi:hypothetical protein
MTEKEMAVLMYAKGYRYILHPPEGSDMDPLYTKSTMDIGPVYRCMWLNARVNAQSIDEYLK